MKRFVLANLFMMQLFLVSCMGDQEYSLPELEYPVVEPSGNQVTISALKDALLQEILNNQVDVLTLEDELYLVLYVISTDIHGNFFEELIMQDSPDNPSAGIRILLDSSPLFPSFEKGRKVFIQLRGLSIGMENGQLTLGLRDGSRIRHIPESMIFDHVLRDQEVAEITPREQRISELSDDQINTFIKLTDVQFNRTQVLGEDHLSFSGEPEDEFDGERVLESCQEAASIVFSTSTFADFSSVLLPQGRGEVAGVFTYNFFGDEFNIVVNGLDDLILDNPERCDPAEINCGIAKKSGEQILFAEFFEEQDPGQVIAGNGWTNFAAEGTQRWEAYTATGTNASLGISARIDSYQSGDDSSIAWLIMPEIDFDQQQGETLSFKTSNSFADDSTLELYYSDNWDGNVESIQTANWELLSAATLVTNDDFFGDWIFSGLVDLSCVEGTGHIAWKYVGSGEEDLDGTFELDEIELRSF